MEEYEKRLNNLLMDTFRDISKMEESVLQNEAIPLSICEVHLIESVGDGLEKTRTVTEIAGDLGITAASVTIGVNKLIRKGFLKKEKSTSDRRSVLISLTRDGERVYRTHRLFHRRMVQSVFSGFSDEEKKALLLGLEKLDRFFQEKTAGEEAL